MSLIITKALEQDFPDILRIFRKVIEKGDTYIYPSDTTDDQAKQIWLDKTHAYIAKLDDKTVGTFVIRDNKQGRGSHVSNAGFMVDPDYQGKGIGRKMGNFALQEAKKLGYHSMQFNVVVSTNHVAISLWKSLGFQEIGIIPEGFNHKEHGLVDIHILYRKL